VSTDAAGRYLALKTMMLPRDTNALGTIHGGVILHHLDQAGAIGARWELRNRSWPDRALVTVGIEAVEFHAPVFVGDVVSFWTETVRVGRTSLTIRVSVESERKGATIEVTDARITYVAVDIAGDRRPVPLHPDGT
jgi:acyl-CoA thioesterase YciA